MVKNSVKSIELHKIWKIHNKNFKTIFDSINENLFFNSKEKVVVEEKKNYDYLFLHIDTLNIKEMLKLLTTSFENYDVN